MSKPRYSAYSYMLKDNTCQGIPSQDRPKYEEESRECVRETIIPTPIQTLAKMAAVKPLISAHLVEKQVKSGQVCISKQKVNICSKFSPLEAGQPKPVEVRPKRVQYTCFAAPSLQAQQLEQRAKSGETLTVELLSKPVAFSKTEYEPVVCKSEVTNHI